MYHRRSKSLRGDDAERKWVDWGRAVVMVEGGESVESCWRVSNARAG